VQDEGLVLLVAWGLWFLLLGMLLHYVLRPTPKAPDDSGSRS
jgi:hypothetical protein